MRKYLLLLLFFSAFKCFSQTNFVRQLTIPVTENNVQLQNAWAGGINFPWLSSIELNGDTLEDLFLVDRHNYRILTFINNGNTNRDLAWDYAPQYAGQFPAVNKFAFLFDYNCDNKPDFFTLSSSNQCSSGIVAYKNVTVTPGNLQWVKVDSCMQETFMGSPQTIFTDGISLPHFTDVDGDGDMDILGYNSFPNGRIVLHKNYSIEHTGTCDSLDFVFETGCYGNFSLNIGGTNSVGAFHSPCRIGRFDHDEIDIDTYDQSQAAQRDDTISSLYSLDLDGDNHPELLIGDIASHNTLMVHNGGIEMDSQDTLFPVSNIPALFDGFHYHAYFDTDNDGLKDLIASPYYNENKNGIWTYKNSGTNSSPVLQFQQNDFLQKTMIDGGEDACPVFFDYDSDNLTDFVMNRTIFNSTTGALQTGLYLFKNTGTISNPAFELIDTNFANLQNAGYLSPIYPSFGDLDGDGDKDMLIGMESGKFQYFQNIAPASSPATFAVPVANYMGIDIGQYSTPQLYDIDKDGLLDIITGTQRGTVVFFKNTGTVNSPAFSSTATNDSLGCVVLQHTSGILDGYTVPFCYDSAGQTRMVVACDLGNIFTYDNIDGNLNGCFHQTGKVYLKAESSRVRFNMTVNGTDINGDTLTDIIVGQSTGGAEILYQKNPFVGIETVNYVRPTFEIFPNPADQFFELHLYHFEKSAEVRMFNSMGQIIRNKFSNEKIIQLSTAGLSSGIYFVQVNSGGYSLSRKVVVKH